MATARRTPRPTPVRIAAADTVDKMLAENMRGYTVAEFAETAGVSIATIRRILDALKADGKVRSYQDPYDRRYNRWQLAANIAPIDRRRK